MPSFKVNPAKQAELLERMQRLGVREEDLVEKFIRGSGAGGQKINKTSVCVYLLHAPSGLEVRCQRERSQSTNRYLARRMLCDKLEGKSDEKADKIRKQKARRKRRAKDIL
jgi:protein subunit release factor B